MLDVLAKRDKEWREMAYRISNCHTLSDDLVNDMYLIVASKQRVNEAYIYRTIKGLYLDHLKIDNRNVSLNDFHYVKEDKCDRTKNRYELLDILQDVSFFEREVLLQTHEKSLRKCEEDTGVHYGVFNYHKTKALKKLQKKYGTTKR